MNEMVKDTIEIIEEQGDQLETLLAIGRKADGKIEIITLDGEKEKLIVLLERAKNVLVRSLDP